MASPERAAERVIYKFGPYYVDSGQGCIKRDGELIRLTPKAFATLLALVEQPGNVLSKEILLQQVWADSFVEEGVLAQNVATLRKVLGASPTGNPYIETIPKRGYRFSAPVEVEVPTPQNQTPVTVANESSPSAPNLPEPVRQIGISQPIPSSSVMPGSSRSGLVMGIAALIVLVLVSSTVYFFSRHSAASSLLIKKEVLLVVMPMGNYTPDPNDDYLSEGFTEEMIHGVGGLLPAHLRVIPFPVALALKGEASSVESIRNQLGADYLLYSDLVFADDQNRVRSRLVRASDGKAMWNSEYLPRTQDIRKMSRDVVVALAKDTGIESGTIPEPKIPGQIDNEQAYKRFLQGRYYLNLRSHEGLDQAILLFKDSIAREPKYSEAYAGLAESYDLMVFYGWMAPHDGIAMAMAASQKAIELDEESAEAHASLGYAKFFWKHDWDGAEAHFRRALQLDPELVSAHHWYALLLVAEGRNHEAVAQMRIAQKLNPLSRGVLSGTAYVYYLSHEYAKAAEESTKALTLYGDLMAAYAVRGLAMEQLGRPKDAVLDFERALSIQGGNAPTYLTYLAHANAMLGKRKESEQILERLWRPGKQSYLNPAGVAAVYAALGRQDDAIRWVSAAIEDGDSDVVWLRTDPRFSPLLETAAFKKLTEPVFLTPVQTAKETTKDTDPPMVR